MITECCGVAIADDHRFCPKCGYEARVEARRTVADHYGAGWLAGRKSCPTCGAKPGTMHTFHPHGAEAKTPSKV